MIKKWRFEVSDNGSRVVLYTFTKDAAIKTDLEAGPSGSLILQTRAERVQGATEMTSETDHRDLAVGAFDEYCRQLGYVGADGSFGEVAGIPENLKGHEMGGHSLNGYMQVVTEIYEDRL